MNQARLSEKRQKRTMASRHKRKERARRLAQDVDAAKKIQYKRLNWLADLGREHQEAARQAQISRRSDPAMLGHGGSGITSRIKSFFSRRAGV